MARTGWIRIIIPMLCQDLASCRQLPQTQPMTVLSGAIIECRCTISQRPCDMDSNPCLPSQCAPVTRTMHLQAHAGQAGWLGCGCRDGGHSGWQDLTFGAATYLCAALTPSSACLCKEPCTT